MKNLTNFDPSTQKLKNPHFNGLLLAKVYIYCFSLGSTEKFDDTQDWLTKFEGKLICCFKNDKNLLHFDPSTQKSQNLHFDMSFLVMFDLIKSSRVIFHDTRE